MRYSSRSEFHERPHELGSNEPHVVAKPCQDSCPVMGAAAGFHHDAARGPVGEKRHKLSTFENLVVDCAGLRLDIVNLESYYNLKSCHTRIQMS